MVIINFANKLEIIIIIRDKKNRDKFIVRWKKIGEKKAGEKFTHFSPTFFPDKVQRITTSGAASDNEWQRVAKNDNEWQRMTASDKTNE